MKKQFIATALAALTATGANAQPGACAATSGPGTAALVELYTSEGCSSCPPADRWLSTLRSGGHTPDRLVPLGLHVDYWDYIGWKDPFASAAYSARQREIAAVNRSRVVYTPQVVLGGRDYRGWSSRRFAEDIATINAVPARARITLAVKPGGTSGTALNAAAVIPAGADRDGAALYVALYENGLSNRVTAGENRGVTLSHHYVVREWWGPIAVDGAGSAALDRPLDPQRLAKGGLAAFVQNRRSGEVLQALALPACQG